MRPGGRSPYGLAMQGPRLSDRLTTATRAHPAAVDATWAVTFVLLAFASTVDGASGGQTTPATEPGGVALLLCASLPFLVRRKAPVTVFVVSALAVLVLSGIGYFEGATPLIPLLGAYTVGARCRPRVAVAAYVFLAAGLVTLFVSDPPGSFDFGGLLANLALYAVAFLVGANLTSRRTRVEALEERAAALEREQEEEARRAVSEERLRIAQELHDVVAHSMGVIAVQAGAGVHVIDTDPAEAKRALEAISATSRTTLTEIRRLLGVLRDDEGAAAYAPAPGTDDLRALVAELTAAGVPTELHLHGETTDVPKGVELTAYRIVQEALTNVLKHGGPGASARVEVTFVPGAVDVEVADDGRGIDLSAAPAGGHGLVGMRERVGVYGGTLDAGPRPAGGFRVRAHLPYDAEAPVAAGVDP